MKSGHIYLLANPAYRENYHKLGKTADTVEKRAKDLSRPTGVPNEFVIVYQHQVVDCDAAENLAKKKLNDYRDRNNKEFFVLPQNEAIKILMEVVSIINATSDVEDEENAFANCIVDNIRRLFETGQVCSLSGDALKIKLFHELLPGLSRLSFTLDEFADNTGISKERIVELLKQLNIKTEEQIEDEFKQQEAEYSRWFEELKKEG